MEEVGMMNNFYKFLDNDELLEQFSQKIVDILENEISKKGSATLLVSGGNTPKALFDKLSNINISWDKVKVGLCDERWINTKEKDSNENLVKTHLIKNYAKEAKFISMYLENISIQEAQKKCTQIYKEELYPFDIVILGMGEDGHTASLFPNNIKLEEAFDLNSDGLCIFMTPCSAPYDRMSLNLKAILSARNIFLHIEGKKKLKVYNEALENNDRFNTPIISVLKQEMKDIEVFYYE
jgi:6-phosphogluconolactonase